MSRLSFRIRPVAAVPRDEQEKMLQLFLQYYDLPDSESFFRDFSAKDDVILLYDKRSKELKGFSTQLKLRHEIDGKSYVGVFSGDTIIDREYWGDYTLGWAFFWYLTRLCLPWPWRRVYWHLISKGYKTYLLMTNNFRTFYPRYDRQTPAFFQSLSEDFARQLYPRSFDRAKGLLVFDGPHEHLKTNVAPITEDLVARFPHIAFFAKRNPHWERGDELVCVAEYHVFLPLLLGKKLLTKGLRRLLLPKPSRVR